MQTVVYGGYRFRQTEQPQGQHADEKATESERPRGGFMVGFWRSPEI
jgi:hypothetical protein